MANKKKKPKREKPDAPVLTVRGLLYLHCGLLLVIALLGWYTWSAA